ncbi:MAG: chromate transporter [Sphaerochaetaceae bacterium]|jgi:chromate transporter
MILLQLLWSFIQIGVFSFGGGYAALPLIQEQVVTLHRWLTVQEFADVVTMSQMTPGPISLNAASFVGTKMAGIPGALVATFGNVLPSLLIVLILAWIYFRYRSLKIMQGVLYGLKPAVVALIASAGLSILFLALFGTQDILGNIEHISWYAIALFGIGFLFVRIKKANPIFIILGSGALTVLLSLVGVSV